MGMPMYGQGFTLANPSENGLNAPAAGPSQAGEFTRANGFLSYYEVNICIEKKVVWLYWLLNLILFTLQICQKVRTEQWTVVQDAEGRRGPYAYKGNQWVGYDDVHSIGLKVSLIVRNDTELDFSYTEKQNVSCCDIELGQLMFGLFSIFDFKKFSKKSISHYNQQAVLINITIYLSNDNFILFWKKISLL